MRRARYNAVEFRRNRESNQPEVHVEWFRCAALSHPVCFHSHSRLRAERKRPKSSAKPVKLFRRDRRECHASFPNNAAVVLMARHTILPNAIF